MSTTPEPRSTFDDFLTREQLAERWRVSQATLRRLESRNVLVAVDLPGRRSGQYRLADVQTLERQYRYAGEYVPEKKRAPDDVLAERDRQQEIWAEFSSQCSPLDELRPALERALATVIAVNSAFSPDDVEDFLSERRAEYAAVLAIAAKRDAAGLAEPLAAMMGAR